MDKKLTKVSIIFLTVMLLIFNFGCAAEKQGAPKELILATTTSTRDSGLLDELVPMFESKTGYDVKTIAVGTGNALAMGRRGDADVLFVHAPSAEQELVEEGVGINYELVMHNDFIIVGPPGDPAGIRGLSTAPEAFSKIKNSPSLFVSRGDDSGTHKKEKSIWEEAGIQPGGNYQETGSGMGETLSIASEKGAYTLTDRATYLRNREHLNLDILVEGDPLLLNIYHVMQVNPERFSRVNGPGGEAFVEFMVSPEVQRKIGDFGVQEFGQPLFFPDAGKKMEDLLKIN